MKDIHVVDEKYLALIELDKNETVVCMLKKHPIGLIGIYLTGLFISFAVLFSGVLASAWLNSELRDSAGFPVGMVLLVVVSIITVLALFFTYVSGFIYNNNIIIVTSDKVAQILYRNLIDRKISQIALGEVQDVTVDQRGLLARLFHYGTLVIETAGEQNNYNFTYTPYPYECAKELVGAREQSVVKYGN